MLQNIFWFILGTLVINENEEPFELNLQSDMADKLLSLYKSASNGILSEVDVMDRCKAFDSWLHKTEPILYDRVMSDFMSELHLRLQECFYEDDEFPCGLINVLPPIGRDDCFWWPENQNSIAIESFRERR